VLLLLGDDLDGVVLLVAFDAILLAALIAEHLRIEREDNGSSSADDGGIGHEVADEPLEDPPAGVLGLQ
jgi:hypothetical protein